MTNTNHEAWIRALEESGDPNSIEKQKLVDTYGFRPLDKLEVNADERYVIVSFKDSPRITHIFKYPDDGYVIWEVENELHRAMQELTEENEESILQAIFTLWLMNGRLSYFAQFTDAQIDVSETLVIDIDEAGNIMEREYLNEFGAPFTAPDGPVEKPSHSSGTGFG